MAGVNQKHKVITTANNNVVLHRYQPKSFEKKYRQTTKIGGGGGDKLPVTIIFRLASDLFRTLCEFLDQSQKKKKVE